ncbi:MAG TPA: hypothetical protein VMF11_03300 [Candidatus Baltobacteraceae bacterium]|nr:hypothetical protein [Candidatus Baltobacteraceae bacterium]
MKNLNVVTASILTVALSVTALLPASASDHVGAGTAQSSGGGGSDARSSGGGGSDARSSSGGAAQNNAGGDAHGAPRPVPPAPVLPLPRPQPRTPVVTGGAQQTHEPHGSHDHSNSNADVTVESPPAPGAPFLQRYGLTQTRCGLPNLVEILEPNGSEICALPNGKIVPGIYHLDPETLTLISP